MPPPGSEAVFSSTPRHGNPTELPIPETAVKAPTNTYGATKLAVDMALTSEAIGHGLAAVSLRYFNVAGAHLDGDVALGERHDPETPLIPIALAVAAGRREKLHLFGRDYPTVDRTCVRAYIHVAVPFPGHCSPSTRPRPASTASTTWSNRQAHQPAVVDVVREVTDTRCRWRSPRARRHPAELVASSRLAREELGWVPGKPTLHDMVGDAWSFYRTHVLADR